MQPCLQKRGYYRYIEVKATQGIQPRGARLLAKTYRPSQSQLDTTTLISKTTYDTLT